jgi:hypothetical protein
VPKENTATASRPTKKAEAALPTIRQGSVDGIPALWVPQAGPQVAMLRFRVGTADESLLNHGITHLVEHLTLHTIERGKFEFNGWVGLNTTTFAASGTRPQVQGFVRDVCAALRSLPLERFADEVRVLRTEEAQRRPGVIDHALTTRYGAGGYGVSWWEEVGFDTVSAEDVQAHADRYFGAANAVLLLSGSPRGFHAELPARARHELPEPEPVVSLPGWMGAFDNTQVGASWMSERGAANGMMLRFLETRLMERLRHDKSLVYSVNTHAERVGARAHHFVGSQVLKESRVEAANAFVEVARAFAEEPITKQELTSDRQKARRALAAAARGSAVGWLDRAADRWLFNQELMQPADVVKETLAVTVDDIAAAAAQTAESMLWFLPDGASTKDMVRAERNYSEPGVAKVAVTSKAFFDGDVATVVAGAEGVTHQFKQRSVTYRWPDVAAWITYDSGRNMLVHRNGATLNFEPKRWSKEASLIRVFEDAHLADRRVERPDYYKPSDVPPPPMSARALGRGVVDGLLAAVTVIMTVTAVSLFVDFVTKPSGDSFSTFLVGLALAIAPAASLVRRRRLHVWFREWWRKRRSG